jgi:hypothetical protein
MRKRRSERWARVKIPELRWRAARLGVPFDLKETDLVLPTHCPIFGTTLVLGEGRQSNSSPSVDRIVPELGYVAGNVVVVSNRANSLKREATLDELQQIVNFYKGLTQ